MQDLKLADGMYWNILQGSKTAVITVGKHIDTGALAFETPSGGSGIIVNVIRIHYKKFSELSEDDVQLDNSINLDALRKSVKRSYPFVSDDDNVNVVEFVYTDPFISLDEDFKW